MRTQHLEPVVLRTLAHARKVCLGAQVLAVDTAGSDDAPVNIFCAAANSTNMSEVSSWEFKLQSWDDSFYNSFKHTLGYQILPEVSFEKPLKMPLTGSINQTLAGGKILTWD